MKTPKPKKPIFNWTKRFALGCLATAGSLNTLVVQAANAEFADDFSVNSIRYSVSRFSQDPNSGTADVMGDALVLTAQKGTNEQSGNVFVQSLETTDSLMITAAFNQATSLPSGDNAESATLAVEQRIYNTIADGGLGDGSAVGDVQVRFDLRLRGDGSTENGFCVGEQKANSFDPVNLFDGSSCAFFDGVTIENDVEYTFGFSLDREAKTLTLSLNENSRTVSLEGTLFAATNAFTGFQLIHAGGPGSAEARVRKITTDTGTDTITENSSIGRYGQFNVGDGSLRSATWTGESIQLSARSTEQDNSGIQLRIAQPTDYIEAVIEISSQTMLGANGRQYSEVRADFYNDTADGGFNGREGDVSSSIGLVYRADGTRRIDYCLQRSADADSNDRPGLLEDGERCLALPIRLELDTPYRISLQLDREQSTLTYRVNGFTHTQTLTTSIFMASRHSAEVGTYPNTISTSVITIDDLRTTPAAVTATEQTAGLTAPAPFPAPFEPPVSNNALSNPVFNATQTLNFVDDFSTNSMRYGFWDGRDRGQVSVSRPADGSFEFEVNNSDPDTSNYAEFYVPGPTDLVEARLSLSSLSELPQSDEVQVTAQVQGTFYNDTADGGTDEQLGDVFISLQIRLRGDGKRDADLYMERRAADGNRDARLELVPDGDNVFEDFVPALDTEYTLSLELDRTNKMLRARIDDLIQEIAIPTDVFMPARSAKQVQISYRGMSGRGVGRIHAITTGDFTDDFALTQTLVGPYRPAFDARYPGVEVNYEEGRVKLVADSAVSPDRGANLQARGASDYVGATMLMSSETTANGEGEASIGVGGLFYNDLADGGNDGATGSVYATVAINMETDANGVAVTYAEYCAFRSSDANFDATVELIGADIENCPRFAMPAMTEVAYEMSVQLDRARKVLEFRLNDEMQEYAIATPIFTPHDRFNGARARASDGAKAVGYADKLSYSSAPVSLASSTAVLGGSPATTTTDSSSGGGCSISSTGRDPLLPLLAIASLLIGYRRVNESAGVLPSIA